MHESASPPYKVNYYTYEVAVSNYYDVLIFFINCNDYPYDDTNNDSDD